MRGFELAPHALAMAHGVGAAFACAVLFYVGGVSLLPRRLGRFAVPGEMPAFVGAAIFVLTCWWGVALGIPVARLAVGFAVFVLAAGLVRFRHGAEAIRGQMGPRSVRWLLVFVLFYVLAYLFTMPPVTGDHLPPAWLGNIDLLTYVRYTRYVLQLGPSNLAHADFSLLGFIYPQTPAVFYLLGLLSMFFRVDPLSAAMPAAFALTALTGVLAARISRSIFRVPRWAAIALGGILVSGPFFRYIAGNYFLSTLMSMPVALFLVWTTVSQRPSRTVDVGLAVRFASAYVLLLFLYPLMLAVGIAAQGAAVLLMVLAEWPGGSDPGEVRRGALSNLTRRLGTICVPLALLATAFFPRLVWSAEEILFLSEKNINGWPLDLISPLAILGVPATWVNADRCGFCVGMEATSFIGQWTAPAIFLGIPAGLAFLYLWRFRTRTRPAQQVLAVMAAGAFAAYYVFFLLEGISYQQWKFASYAALPWSFVVLAAGLRLVDVTGLLSRAVLTPARGRIARVLLPAVVIAAIGGNLLAHALAGPELEKLPADLGQLANLNAMAEFPEISVMMDETFNGLSSWLALYLLPNKQVHVISRRNSPNEPLSWESISRLRPLFIEHFGCDGIGHDEARDVPRLGCLLYAPPSLRLDTPYPFNRTYLFITPAGMGLREPEGRWNLEPAVGLNLMTDIARTNVFDEVFLNLRISPYLPPGTTRQRLVISWGAGQHGEASLDATRSISVPIRRADWTGLRVWTLPVSIQFPDRVPPPWMYAPKGHADSPPLAALFEELSVTRVPSGIIVTPTHEASRP